jgi:hypothetical protein
MLFAPDGVGAHALGGAPRSGRHPANPSKPRQTGPPSSRPPAPPQPPPLPRPPTVTTACLTDLPRKASAVSFIFWRIMALISSGLNTLAVPATSTCT